MKKGLSKSFYVINDKKPSLVIDVLRVLLEFNAIFDDIGLSKFVAIDLETTGLDPSKDKIIEISAVKFNNGEVVDSLTFLVNPAIKLKPKIIQITGINDSMLVSKPSFDDIKDHFLMFIENLPIVGHNVMFDLNFLKKNIHDYEKYFKGRMI